MGSSFFPPAQSLILPTIQTLHYLTLELTALPRELKIDCSNEDP
jgi:hypothetical protein